MAYNDVDLCLRLHAAGYRNVIRNDVKLLHYESASRGDDKQDEKKKQRLKKELLKLYERNPGYVAVDPYEHERLSDESVIYEEAHPYENKKLGIIRTLQQLKDRKAFAPVNETLIIRTDYMGTESGGRSLKIDIHVHVHGWDNADYTYHAYLEGEGRRYILPLERRYRSDVEEIYRDQINVGLSGLAGRIAKEAIAPGEYSLWIEARSRISRQRLFRMAEDKLKVE